MRTRTHPPAYVEDEVQDEYQRQQAERYEWAKQVDPEAVEAFEEKAKAERKDES